MILISSKCLKRMNRLAQQTFVGLLCCGAVKLQLRGLNGSTWWFSPVISRRVWFVDSFPLLLFFFAPLFARFCCFLPLSLSVSLPPSSAPWHPRGWRPSAARTETRRRSSWSPSSRSCSGRWVWEARLWASCLLFYKFCRNAKDTGDSGSILCRGPRPPRGSCSSSVYVTFWDAQVTTRLLEWANFLNLSCDKGGKQAVLFAVWFCWIQLRTK